MVYLLGMTSGAMAGDDVALPGLGVVFTEYLDVHFFPEHFRQFGAVFPQEEVGDNPAAFGGTHTHDVLAVEFRIQRIDFCRFIRFGQSGNGYAHQGA